MFRKTNIKNLAVNEILFPNWQIFILFAVINILISSLAYRYIFTRELYYSLLSDQMELTRIDTLIDVLKRYTFLGMLLIPAVLFIKYTINTLLLQLPMLLNFIEIRFGILYRLVMFSSTVLMLGQIVYFFRIYLSSPEHISRKLLIIKPLSVAALVDSDAYPPASLFILNQFNLFECLWIGCIFFGLLRTNSLKKLHAAMLAIFVWSIILFMNWAAYFFVGKLQ